jgi:hypothetical protein
VLPAPPIVGSAERLYARLNDAVTTNYVIDAPRSVASYSHSYSNHVLPPRRRVRILSSFTHVLTERIAVSC